MANPAESWSGNTSLLQRAEDLHERALIGGVFYLLSWLIVAGQGGAWQRFPTLTALFCGVFVVLGVARLLIRRWSQAGPGRDAASLRAQWTVLLATAALWGSLSAWALWQPDFSAAYTPTLLSTSSLAMAFAQIFAVNRRIALVGTGLLFLPMLGIVLARMDQPGVALVLILDLGYLVAVAFLIADLDHFKTINDRYGHAAGDCCLREVAVRLRSCFAGTRGPRSQGRLAARMTLRAQFGHQAYFAGGFRRLASAASDSRKPL